MRQITLIPLALIALALMSFACAENEDSDDSVSIDYLNQSSRPTICTSLPCEGSKTNMCDYSVGSDKVAIFRVLSVSEVRGGRQCGDPYRFHYYDVTLAVVEPIHNTSIGETLHVVSLAVDGSGGHVPENALLLGSMRESESEFFLSLHHEVGLSDSQADVRNENLVDKSMPRDLEAFRSSFQTLRAEAESYCPQELEEFEISKSTYDSYVRQPYDCEE